MARTDSCRRRRRCPPGQHVPPGPPTGHGQPGVPPCPPCHNPNTDPHSWDPCKDFPKPIRKASIER